jgi:hypothetical protein
MGPVVPGGPIQVPLMVKDQPREGVCAVGGVVLRAETVEDCLLAFGSELEYNPGSVGAAVFGRPIQISLLVEDETCKWLLPIGAVGLGTEAVKHTLGLGPRRTQQ